MSIKTYCRKRGTSKHGEIFL